MTEQQRPVHVCNSMRCIEENVCKNLTSLQGFLVNELLLLSPRLHAIQWNVAKTTSILTVWNSTPIPNDCCVTSVTPVTDVWWSRNEETIFITQVWGISFPFFIFPYIQLKMKIMLSILATRESLRKRKQSIEDTLSSSQFPSILPRYFHAVRRRELFTNLQLRRESRLWE